MRQPRSEAVQWGNEQFGDAALGDRRRRDRLLSVAARACERPGGRISEVFQDAGELHEAYDFVENDHVPPSELIEAMGRATALRCAGLPFVYVAVDGSSLTLADHDKAKDFGALGSGPTSSRGLKVISALALDAQGTTMGLLTQQWWARAAGKKKSRNQRARLALEQKETRHWVAAFEEANAQCAARDIRPSFIVDREGDACDLLLALLRLDALFTVRASWNRVVQSTGKDKQYLRAAIAAMRPLSVYELHVPAGLKRRTRVARMELRATRVTVRLRDTSTKKYTWTEMSAVWALEAGTTPEGETPLDWLLYTNVPVGDAEQARRIVRGYANRWRIEDFHKTWKTAGCNVERTQLRTAQGVVRWATILAAVATRIERLKHLARTQPDQPATAELTHEEIHVLVALARRIKKRAELAPSESLTIASALEWVARIGGYTGKSSGGPPGSITIGRGLERLQAAVDGVRAVRELDGR